jgi:glycosyltransferase involved in cell wall biosynthesis
MGGLAYRRVAVIIPVYEAGFLAEALGSVLTQARPPDEVIVIDDGSPDPAAVDRALSLWPGRMQLLRQANRGAAAARNAGLAATHCDWVAFLDADDRWSPLFLLRQLAFLDANPSLDLAWADATIVGDTPAAGERFMTICPSSGDVTLESLLSQTCTVLTSTVVVRRRLVIDVGLFDVALRRGQDFDLWLRLVSRGARASYQREVLAFRRLHGRNLSGTRLAELDRALRVFDKALRTLPLTARERDVACTRVGALTGELALERGKARLAAGDFAAARQLLAVAHRSVPTWKLRAARVALRLAPAVVRRLYMRHGGASPARVTLPA